jgi:AGZA family xanthine/uracil permease-like MFS transporter
MTTREIKTEIIAGFTTFFTAMYIIVVNPAILAPAGFDYNASLTATVLVSALSSIGMGLYAKNPIIVAPGMGLNAFVAISLMNQENISPNIALGAIFWSGIVFILLSVFNIRNHILLAIPKEIRHATAVGIGLFISLIGFVNAGFIVKGEPLSSIHLKDPIVISFLVFLLLASILSLKKVKGAFIITIILGTLLAWPIGRWYGDASVVNYGMKELVVWKGWFEMPDFNMFFKMDLWGALHWSILPLAIGILFADMFDSIGTFAGVAEACDLKDENGNPKNMKKSLIVDAFATLFAGIFGTTPGTAYIESAAGIEAGGRTGLTAIVAGLLFLPFMFFSPLLSIVPGIATAPVLILVGIAMMKPVKEMNWAETEYAIPSFLTLLLIPLTYSITQGIIWGILSYTILSIFAGKGKDLPISLYMIDLFIILLLIVD